jgi:hypothetical protein
VKNSRQPASQLGRTGCIIPPSVFTFSAEVYFAQPTKGGQSELQRLQFPHRHLNFCECTQRVPQTAHLSWNEHIASARRCLPRVLVIHFAFSGGRFLWLFAGNAHLHFAYPMVLYVGAALFAYSDHALAIFLRLHSTQRESFALAGE